MNLIVALDPSLTATGWCIWNADHTSKRGYVASGVVRGAKAPKGITTDQETQDVAERLRKMEEDLRAAVMNVVICGDRDHRWWFVVEADLISGNRRGQRNYGSMDRYHFAAGWLARAFNATTVCAPIQWKGNDPKQAAIWKAEEVTGKRKMNDNEADAVCIAQWAAAELQRTRHAA